MRKVAMLSLLMFVVSVVFAGVAVAAEPVNDTYNTAFHVWDVCCRGVDKCAPKCDPCPQPCAPKCEPCCPKVCTPPPCCPVPTKCCPAPVCEYPDPCDRESGEFARDTVSRLSA